MKSIYKNTILAVLILTAGLLIPVDSFGQTIKEYRADQWYENYAYSKAVEFYEAMHVEQPSNTKYIQRLAYSYYKMLDYKKALKYYSLLVQSGVNKPEDFYEYAQLLRIDGQLDESRNWLVKYIISAPGDQRAKNQLENINILLELKSNVENITVKNLEMNTRYTDMCPTFYKGRMVYSSAKDSFSIIRNNFKWNNEPFLDLFESDAGPDPNLKNDRAFSSAINSRFHEGPVCFTNDQNTIYFTRNSFLNGKVVRTAEGVNNLKIFIANLDGKEWKNIRSFPYNSDKYSVGHPTLSPDNQTLYFISDMPGGFGETDVYKSVWNGTYWGKPLNLGESINTKGKEMFPYVDKDGILYFSSDGQPSIGGLDVFAAKEEENGKYILVNLGSPLNSPYDDFGFVIEKDSLQGYFTSNRPGGKGVDDNYYYKVIKIDLRIQAFDDATKTILPGTKISLMKDNGQILDSKVSDKDGFTEFSVVPRSKIQLIADKNTHQPATKDISIAGTIFNFRQREEVYLKQGAPYLNIEIVDKESGLIIPKAIVDISEGKYDESELEDNNGVIRMKMNESTKYTFYVSAEGYFENTVEYSSEGKAAGDYSLTIELDKIAAGKQFVLDDLYYDLNKYNIRPDAAIVLDRLLKILQDNPEVRIEIGSHTDSRASAKYNDKLSQNRSESVMAYLIGKGISASRLVAKGYGESQLINKCADGVICPEVDHQANRRTVIEILNPEIRKVKRGAKNVYYF